MIHLESALCSDANDVILLFRALNFPSLETSPMFPYYDLSLACGDAPSELALTAAVGGDYWMAVYGGSKGAKCVAHTSRPHEAMLTTQQLHLRLPGVPLRSGRRRQRLQGRRVVPDRPEPGPLVHGCRLVCLRRAYALMLASVCR